MDLEEILECIRDYNGNITIGQLLKSGMRFNFDDYTELTIELEKHFNEDK